MNISPSFQHHLDDLEARIVQGSHQRIPKPPDPNLYVHICARIKQKLYQLRFSSTIHGCYKLASVVARPSLHIHVCPGLEQKLHQLDIAAKNSGYQCSAEGPGLNLHVDHGPVPKKQPDDT
jgi:hypothetical protein